MHHVEREAPDVPTTEVPLLLIELMREDTARHGPILRVVSPCAG